MRQCIQSTSPLPNFSKHNLEELDLVVSVGERIVGDTLLGGAVSGRRPRIKHLERIAAAKRSRDHSLNAGSL